MSFLDIPYESFFCGPAILVGEDAGQQRSIDYGNITVQYAYNTYGYRTHEFDVQTKEHALVVGCSLSEGEGLHLHETWTDRVEKNTQQLLFNLSKRGTNAEFACQNIKNWLEHFTPSVVIAQWPDAHRMMSWQGNTATCVTAQNPEHVFHTILKYAETNFWANWTNAVLTANMFCQQKKIPILNLYLGVGDLIPEMVKSVLQTKNIFLEIDNKTVNHTWHFDSQAHDGLHHSGWCNERWAERIMRLLEDVK
jgi:hypothetical protein